MRDKIKTDALIVGAGVIGLTIAKKLANLGIDTVLIEKHSALSKGASTKNEGWLHRGTYHAATIPDHSLAGDVARRCIYGHDQILTYAPEAIIDWNLPTFAVVRNKDDLDEVMARWDDSGVIYDRLTRRQVTEQIPALQMEKSTAVFNVQDKAINTRVLFKKLLVDAERHGTRVFNATQLKRSAHGSYYLSTKNAAPIEIEAKLFIYAAGYGVKALFKQLHQMEIPLRYWKGHLMIVPRLTHSSVFCIDHGEAGMMNHGKFSIVGMNGDAYQCDTPNYEVNEAKVVRLKEAMERLFNVMPPYPYKPVACLKVDFAQKSSDARSLNRAIAEPIANHIIVLPGKMT